MYDILMIVGPEMAAGFRLAGVHVHPASTEEEVRSGLKFALDPENEVGLAVVDEDLLLLASERLRKKCEASAIPLVLPLPLSRGQDDGKTKEAVQEMVRSAIGFTIKLD